MDDTAQNWVAAGYAEAGGFLFGRRTYELLAGYWPNAKPEEAPVAAPLNTLPKCVEHDLVDRFRVMLDPLIVGGGKRFLSDHGVKRPMQLRDSTVTSTGAILATYDMATA